MPGLTSGISSNDYPFKEEVAFFKALEAKKKERRIYNLLRHPFRTYITNYSYGLFAGAVCAGIFSVLLITGGMDALFPE